MKTICIIGYGYWGTILTKKFIKHQSFYVKYICDRNSNNLLKAKAIVPDNCILIDNPQLALEDPVVDLIVIATQAIHHFDLCMLALTHHKNIFVEKPFTLNSTDAKTLFDVANKINRKIWVDHTFLFTSRYQKLKSRIQQGLLGKPLRFHSTRTAFGLFQNDTNIIWHLMVHDIYILLDLLGMPERINSVISSASIIPNKIDTVIASLIFSNQLHATIHCDMLFAEKKREIVITGDKGILVWDELRHDKLLFYPYHVTYNAEKKITTHQSDEATIIVTDESDALENELDALQIFLDDKHTMSFPEQDTLLKITTLLESIEAMDSKSCLNVI